MNREIKFRAWVHTYSGKEMIYDWCYLNKEDNHFYATDTTNERPDIGEVYNVMQFTGLFDRKGNEIYEGDLVQHLAWSYPFEIIFNQEKARFVCKLKSGLTQFIDYESLEVIGNIYENKELLNQ